MSPQIMLHVEFKPLGIPYRRSGSEGHSYVDLKAHPGEIEMLPELKDWPVLKSLVQAMNNEQSLLRTLGCGNYFYTPETTGGSSQRTSYLGFCFDALIERTQPLAYYQLF